MNLLPKSREEFSQKEYWDGFFKKRGNKAFEWYGEYPELCEHLHKYIKPKDVVLIAGCGNSTLGNDLYDIGYTNITSIDISRVVVRQMTSLNEKARPALRFLQMDALNMSFADETFSVVLDKGTLDALMPDDAAETRQRIDRYFSEIHRVSKFGGRYVCVSLLQEHILRKLLDYFPATNWMLRIVRCYEAEKQDENSLPVFIVICTKFKTLPSKVLEVNLAATDKMQRCEDVEEVASLVTSVQQAAFVCAGLKRNSMVDESEVAFDLYRQGGGAPRFTIYVVDVKPEKEHLPYAAFIVPQGREAEWLFSTKEGRKRLAKMCKHNRLSIVTMHREQTYENLEGVKSELNDIVKNLALTGVKQKIPFLSFGSDVGTRTARHRGTSKYSGDYIIEDVETDTGVKLRRLYYLQSQLVIQSEAKLKTVKPRKGGKKEKEIVDSSCLTCTHHTYMSIFTQIACESRSSPSVVVIGLGGGGLCTFLRKFIPKATIKAVDIDEEMLEVATRWFGLSPDDNLQVEIADGVEFLNRSRTDGKRFDAVLFDVDSKDTTIGMSCPPAQFLESATVDNVMACLEQTGLFILNVVLRDDSLRGPILNDLKSKFASVISYKLQEDLNEVMACSRRTTSPSEMLAATFPAACAEINRFLMRNGHVEDTVELSECLAGLKLCE